MKLDGTAPTQGPEGRRFQAAKPGPAKADGKSFGALLKKAAGTAPAPAQPSPAPAPASAQVSASPVASTASAASTHSTESAADSEAKVAKKREDSDPADFANHMEMVKLRLKSGYYNNANVNDALSEKLTGFFDDLA